MMPSRKGKGRQSLGFARKSQRAQFHQEWQKNVDEDYYAKRRQEQRQIRRDQEQRKWLQEKTKAASAQTPKGLQNSLRRLIAERQYWDRVEDRSWVYSQHHHHFSGSSTTTTSGTRNATTVKSSSTSAGSDAISPPGWIVFHTTQIEEVDTYAQEFLCTTDTEITSDTQPKNSNAVSTLQALSLQALAKALPEYCKALGSNQLHHYLSLLSGPALTVLSVRVSQLGFMTNELCRVLCQHSHIPRLSIVACPRCDETDPSFKALQPNVALEQSLLPRFLTKSSLLLLDQQQQQQQQAQQQPDDHIPDSWEELASDDEEEEQDNYSYNYSNNNHYSTNTMTTWKGCRQLERLELGRMPLLEVPLLEQILSYCPRLTHLGLAGSLTYDRGPDVLWRLSEWVPNLLVLDVSGNSTWVTEPLLRNVYDSYQVLRQSNRSHNNDSDDENNNLQRRKPPPLIIKASGCLTRSSQFMMEMEYGTIF